MALYDELGGDPAIAAALDRFYEKVLDDDRLSMYFTGVDLAALKQRQRVFFAMLLGGPNEYDGDLRAAHRRPRAMGGLGDERFDAFMGHFRSTLEEFGVDGPKVDEVLAIVSTGKDEVLDR